MGYIATTNPTQVQPSSELRVRIFFNLINIPFLVFYMRIGWFPWNVTKQKALVSNKLAGIGQQLTHF